MAEERQSVMLPDGSSVSTVRTTPDTASAGWQFIYAPGAGSNLNDPFGVYAARWLAERGVTCVRFQFPYAEKGGHRPDPPKLLRATWNAVIEQYAQPGVRTIVGGRSMGGRMASEVVAEGTVVDGLALFAYPLYPPGTTDQWRDKHLPSITVPTLFCCGDRDTMSTVDELRSVIVKMPRGRLHVLQGADHGFQVLKSSGRKREDVWAEAMRVFFDWVGEADTR